MPRYQIWNKTDAVYTLVGEVLTAEQWLERYPWADVPGVKMVIGGGVINGTVAMEFEAMKDMYRKRGAVITDDMSDQEVLDAIEALEDAPPAVEPSAEERIAAAMEFQNLMSL